MKECNKCRMALLKGKKMVDCPRQGLIGVKSRESANAGSGAGECELSDEDEVGE